jgi:uncharacterized membrane protein
MLAFMLLVVAFARFLEAHVGIIKKASSAVVCTLLGILLGNVGVIPSESPIYTAVYDFGVPYSIVLIILASNLRELKVAGARMMGCFDMATVATFVACWVSGVVFAPWIGPETWKVAGQFAGAFVGGGMNFVAVGRGLQTSPSLFAASSVADNLSTVPYILTQIGLAALLTRFYRGVPVWRLRRTPSAPAVHAVAAIVDPPADAGVPAKDPRRFWTDAEISITDMAFLGALPLAAVWLSQQLSPLLPGFPQVLWLTTISIIVAQFPITRRLKGASVVSYFALHLFFIVIGAGSVIAEVVKAGPALFVFMFVIIVIHVVIAYGGGWLLGWDIPNISVASQAAVGGPGSALALSMAMKWSTLVTPGIIAGILGYAIGNYIGFACAYLLRGWM